MTLENVLLVAAGVVGFIAAALWLMDRGARQQWEANRDVIAAAVGEAEAWRDRCAQWERLCCRQQERIAELERSAHPSARYPLNLRLRQEQRN